MKRTEFINAVTNAVRDYIIDRENFDLDPQLKVDPVTLVAIPVNASEMLNTLAENEENVEIEAAADGERSEMYADNQARQDADFYPLRTLVNRDVDGNMVPDMKAVMAVADNYSFS